MNSYASEVKAAEMYHRKK